MTRRIAGLCPTIAALSGASGSLKGIGSAAPTRLTGIGLNGLSSGGNGRQSDVCIWGSFTMRYGSAVLLGQPAGRLEGFARLVERDRRLAETGACEHQR